jgi:hypothetical protein|eukprot:COSAG02_NODE_1519_length_12168_cov_5.127682_4_plen_71_part_00
MTSAGMMERSRTRKACQFYPCTCSRCGGLGRHHIVVERHLVLSSTVAVAVIAGGAGDSRLIPQHQEIAVV